MPVCIQAMLLSLDHEKESVINFHLHLFVVGCDQLQGIDEFVHFDTLIVLIALVVCLYRLTSTSSVASAKELQCLVIYTVLWELG